VSSRTRYVRGQLEVAAGECYLHATDFPGTDAPVVVGFAATDAGP
jgi:hypothetical protein